MLLKLKDGTKAFITDRQYEKLVLLAMHEPEKLVKVKTIKAFRPSEVDFN